MKNPEKAQEYDRMYREKNREKINEYYRLWNKTEKGQAIKKRYAEKNKDQIRKKSKAKRAENTLWFLGYKKTLRCKICLENNPYCLDFHHIDPSNKKYAISKIRSKSKNIVMNEVEKCIVLCANCHRKEHHSI